MKVFKALDANGDGKITKEELQAGYSKSLGITDEEINELMKKLDNDGSGSIDYTEFVAAAMNREKVLTKKRIQDCFQMFDKVSSRSRLRTKVAPFQSRS
jgi:Ca2+-binding EF-hand superfamily protein